MSATATHTTPSAVTTTSQSWSLVDRQWDTFRCRKCQRVLFKFDDGQRHRIEQIRHVRALIEHLAAEGRLSLAEKQAIETTFKHERVIEIKCTLTACKTMNYLMESVR